MGYISYETPDDVFRAVNEEFRFDVDVCAVADNAKCARFFTPEQNGLEQEWSGVCWCNPPRWQRIAEASGTRRRVFCGSMCDWADKNAPAEQRARLWELIRATPNLDWQLLTKRAPNIAKCLPHDWGDGYENVWLGATVENRKHGLPRIDDLRRVPAKVRFLSVEPLLEDLGDIDLTGIHWVIVGGESGHGARPMEAPWAENIKRQCEAAGVAFFFKQWGGRIDKGGCLIDGGEVKQWPRAA